MHIRKARAGSAPGHHWERDGAVQEVPDWFAEELLAIPNGGFSIAEAPEPATPEEPDEEPAEDEPADEDPETTKRSPGRPKLPRDDKGRIVRK